MQLALEDLDLPQIFNLYVYDTKEKQNLLDKLNVIEGISDSRRGNDEDH